MRSHIGKVSFIALVLSVINITPTFADFTAIKLIDHDTIIAATSQTDAFLGTLSTNGSGVFAARDTANSRQDILIFEPGSGTPVRVAVTLSDMIAAIDAANGTDATPTAAIIRDTEFLPNGMLLVATDGSGSEAGTLMALDLTQNPVTINVLCTARNGLPSPIEGLACMTAIGTTAYLYVDSFNGATADQLLSVDCSTIVNDGSKSATVVTNSATLVAAAGATGESDLSVNDIYKNNAGTALLLVNSAFSGANDNIIQADTTGGTASLYLDATDIEADLSTTDVGFGSIGLDAAGTIWLSNPFGTGTEDDGLIKVTNITPPTGTATIFTEAVISTVFSGSASNVFHDSRCLVYDPSSGSMAGVFGGDVPNRGLYLFGDAPSSVMNWSMF